MFSFPAFAVCIPEDSFLDNGAISFLVLSLDSFQCRAPPLPSSSLWLSEVRKSVKPVFSGGVVTAR